MCGIAGCINTHGTSHGDLEQMSLSIAHRGPDDVGLWEDLGIGLAHRRLSIIDLSSLGHQPMHSACGRYVIVFNGEIYNYIELRRELIQLGESFTSDSDTEVLLVAYQHWGRQCLKRFNGMWAFAIWDRVNKCLFASRDRFGKKPFYYVSLSTGFFFASEIKALLAGGMIKAQVNERSVADFAAERVSDHTNETFFKGINQLPGGSWLEWQDGKFRIEKYWNLETDVQYAISAISPEQVLAMLTEAIRLRLRSDTPVGVLLSGGLDSSSIACIAAMLSSTSVHAFSTLDDPPVIEAAGIAQVATQYPNIVIHQDWMTKEHFLDELDCCLWHQEEPFADGSMVAHFRLMRYARQQGIKVLLTGQGADEVFAGYPGYLTIELAGFLRTRKFLEFIDKYKKIKATGQSASWQSAFAYALPQSLSRKLRYRQSFRSIDWLKSDYRNISESVGSGLSFATGQDALNTALFDAINYRTLPGFLHYEDRNSMAHGIETRLPFLDYILAQAVLSTSAEEKTKGGVTKALLRQAVTDVVPINISQRTAKTGYPAPLARWLRNTDTEQWANWIEVVSICPMIEKLRWQKYFESFQQGNDSGLPAVWRGLILSLWYERFIKGKLCA